eukprot:3402439-Amphidinium_carterae.1
MVSRQGRLAPKGALKVSVVQVANLTTPRAIWGVDRTKPKEFVRRPAMPTQNGEGVGASKRINALL